MKKFFTLIAVAMMAFDVSAGEVDILDQFNVNGLWDGEGYSAVKNDDGTVTYNGKQWGGFPAWLGSQDWSAYEKIVVEYAEPTPVGTQILIQGTDVAAQQAAGATVQEASFVGHDMTACSQIAIQLMDAGTVVIKRIYLVEGSGDTPVVVPVERDAYEVDASYLVNEWRTMEEIFTGPANINEEGAAVVYVRSQAQAEAAGNPTLQDGSYADYDSQFFITWDPSLALKDGDKLQLKMSVKAEKEATVGSQCHAAAGQYLHWYGVGDVAFTTDWTEFTSAEVPVTSSKDQWGKAIEDTYTIAFNLAKGEENTYYFKDIQVLLTIPTATGVETKVINVKPASQVRYNLAGQQVDASYKGVVIQNGKKMIQK